MNYFTVKESKLFNSVIKKEISRYKMAIVNISNRADNNYDTYFKNIKRLHSNKIKELENLQIKFNNIDRKK